MYKKLTEEEKNALKQLNLPKYDDSKPETWVGSKDYYEAVFETETNRDPKLHDAFSDLHKKIVNMVIQFCEEHGLKDVDEFYVGADGLSGSYGSHEWLCFTDSYMNMIKLIENTDEKSKDLWTKLPDRDNPFLHEI